MRAGIITAAVMAAKMEAGYFVWGNLELNSSIFYFYRYYPLVRTSPELKGRAQKRV